MVSGIKMDIRKIIYGICFVECNKEYALRLLNICGHRNIKTWSSTSKEEAGFYTYSNNINLIQDIAQNINAAVTITKLEGIIRRIITKRLFFTIAAAVVCMALFVFWASRYIWYIEVSGLSTYTKDEITSVLDMDYPCYGVNKKEIDTDLLSEFIMDSFDKISWASCSITGTKLIIKISEAQDIFIPDSCDMPCNIVASMDCTISSIIANAGTPVVKAGDQVKKGDILISGAVNIMNDSLEIVETKYVCASGEVYGVSNIPYQDKIDSISYKKNITKDKLSSVGITFGRTSVNLYKRKESEADLGLSYDKVYNTYQVHFSDLYLPLCVNLGKNEYYELKSEKRTKSELDAFARKELARYIGKMQEKGVQIVQKNVIITHGTDGVTAEGDMKVIIPVGALSPIDTDVSKDASN